MKIRMPASSPPMARDAVADKARAPLAVADGPCRSAPQRLILDSPRLAAQRREFDAVFGPALQRQAAPEDDERQVEAGAGPAQHQAAPASGGATLPDGLKAGIEALSGLSMDHVRVHYDSPQPAQLQALAYAQGADIHLAPGQQQHLPHEAWHIVQQAQGRVQPTLQARGVPINDDAGLEQEADAMGAKALRTKGTAAAATTASHDGHGPAQRVPQAAHVQGEPGSAAGAEARTAPPERDVVAPGAPVVQRLVGFEIETGIPITARTNGVVPTYGDPGNGLSVDTALGGDIKVDHVSGHDETAVEAFDEWPIIEFVSRPVSEATTPNAFETKARAWLTLLESLRADVNNTPPTVALQPTVAASPAHIHIGFPGAKRAMGEGGVNRVSVQMTIGARLDRMDELVKSIKKADVSGPMVMPAYLFWTRVVGSVSALMPAIRKKVGVAHKSRLLASKVERQQAASAQQQDEQQLQGLLHLLCNYLIVGSNTKSGYLKNRTFVFYKSELSDLAAQLANGNAYAAAVLHGKHAPWVRAKILAATGRASDEAVFPDCAGETNNGVVMPTCGEWLEEVFGGTADRLFNFARNPWSGKLGPDQVGGKLAAVVELRSPSPLDPAARAGFDLSGGIDGIVAHLRALFQLQQRWQDITPPEEG